MSVDKWEASRTISEALYGLSLNEKVAALRMSLVSDPDLHSYVLEDTPERVVRLSDSPPPLNLQVLSTATEAPVQEVLRNDIRC